MWPFTKKKEIEQIDDRLKLAFSKLNTDITSIQHWITHLHEKSSVLERTHASHVELTKRDVENVTKWIHYLNTHNLEVQKYLKEMTSYLGDLRSEDKELRKMISSLERKVESLSQGQDRTQERTTKGHVKDMSLKSKDTSSVSPSPIKIIDKSSLTGSQLQLVRVLDESDRPLSYDDLARLLGKKTKSARNLIYELREKNIDVKSRFIGLRTKGFYLPKEEKVRVSGR